MPELHQVFYDTLKELNVAEIDQKKATRRAGRTLKSSTPDMDHMDQLNAPEQMIE